MSGDGGLAPRSEGMVGWVGVGIGALGGLFQLQ